MVTAGCCVRGHPCLTDQCLKLADVPLPCRAAVAAEPFERGPPDATEQAISR